MKDQMTKRTWILLVLTIVVAVYFAVDFLFLSGKTPRSSRKSSDTALARAAEMAKAAQQKVAAAPTAAGGRHLAPPPPPDQPWGRDPFAIDRKWLPQGPQAANRFAGFTITGVVWGDQGYQALVNDHVVRVGDQVNGARVVRITKEGVELAKDGETHFFSLSEKDFRR